MKFANALFMLLACAEANLRNMQEFETPMMGENSASAGHIRAGCSLDGTTKFESLGSDNSERLLLREGIIDEIPKSKCGRDGRNVILVVGDGMGWEMVRAGAIAKQVLEELEMMGCSASEGCPDNEDAKLTFQGRRLHDYYSSGKGSGLSFQELPGHTLVTTSATVIQKPEDGAHYAASRSMLNGTTADHDDGMAPLYMNECGFPHEFNPHDFEDEGGNMVLWDNVKGGEYPWDENYYVDEPDTSGGFDPEFIMRHATDSASTAGSMATGHKAARGMLSQDIYEEKVSTLVEDAIYCGMAGGVVSSVPMFHATPGAFIIHSNSRNNRDQLRRSFLEGNPTYVGGTCAGQYYPFPETLESMRSGSLSSKWTLLEQSDHVLAKDFFNAMEGLDPDNGDHVLACLGGDFSASGQSNMPYRGVDSNYKNRMCSGGAVVTDPDTGLPISVNVTTSEETCDHYSESERKHIPTMAEHVKHSLEFLAKDDDGFFMMYEQGDIDWAAHSNHMDDMLGAMLDVDEGVREIMDWIQANGGYEKNALYVTADHDHYLTLSDHFPEALASLIIAGESHKITPLNNTGVNPWKVGIQAKRHEDDSKTTTEHIADFSTWSMDDVEMVAHYWGSQGSGGNGWGSHSTRPVPLYYAGDTGCIERLEGKNYQVAGKEVKGIPGKIDQVHLHACMMRQLFDM